MLSPSCSHLFSSEIDNDGYRHKQCTTLKLFFIYHGACTGPARDGYMAILSITKLSKAVKSVQHSSALAGIHFITVLLLRNNTNTPKDLHNLVDMRNNKLHTHSNCKLYATLRWSLKCQRTIFNICHLTNVTIKKYAEGTKIQHWLGFPYSFQWVNQS